MRTSGRTRRIADQRDGAGFFLICAGGAVLALGIGLGTLAAAVSARAQAPVAAPDGAMIYQSAGCAGCHGANGEGVLGPALAGNPEVDDLGYVLNRILHGGGIMPAFADVLGDAEIAAVATYIRTSWDNGTITAEQVAEQRALPVPAP